MGKSIKVPEENRHRNNVARGMILAGTGKGTFMRDRRNRRPKDARRKREDFGQEA